MEISNSIYLKTRQEWREWLEKNHANVNEIWLVHYKKSTGKPTISYGESLEEALCFGWIDSLVKKIDEERYAQKFTPRKKNSQWSDTNKSKVIRLVKEGKMSDAGFAAFMKAHDLGTEAETKPKAKEIIITTYIEKAFK